MLCDIENVFVLLKLQSTPFAVEVKQSTGMYLLREVLTSVTKWKGPDCLEHGPWSVFAGATDVECFLLLLSIFLSPCLTLCFPKPSHCFASSAEIYTHCAVVLLLWCEGMGRACDLSSKG